MRISDWSSDVGSSDLGRRRADDVRRAQGGRAVRYDGADDPAPDADRNGAVAIPRGPEVGAAARHRGARRARLARASRGTDPLRGRTRDPDNDDERTAVERYTHCEHGEDDGDRGWAQ